MATVSDWISQSAALPVRRGQICMVTSSSGRRWVIPKGMIDPGKTAGEIALQEAWEEAGLTGVLLPEPIGSYVYEKFDRTHHVTVFLMQVAQVADDWPEQGLRQRCWLKPRQAMARIEESALRDILRRTVIDNPAQLPA